MVGRGVVVVVVEEVLDVVDGLGVVVVIGTAVGVVVVQAGCVGWLRLVHGGNVAAGLGVVVIVTGVLGAVVGSTAGGAVVVAWFSLCRSGRPCGNRLCCPAAAARAAKRKKNLSIF